MTVFALVGKEWKLLLRDWHALLLLFVMPAVFILVMSLALQNSYAAHQRVNIHYYLLNEDSGPADAALVKEIEALPQFSMLAVQVSEAELIDRVRRNQAQFIVRIPAGFGKALLSDQPVPVQMLAGPQVEPAVYQLFAAALHGALAQVYVRGRLQKLQTAIPGMEAANLAGIDLDAAGKLLDSESLYQVAGAQQRPSSVQQNVPAWLLFAMFFIAIPLSTTWVQERQQGTFARLRSMGLTPRDLLLGKLLPYLGINLLQVILMLAVGVYVVPWLGGGRLNLGQAPLALALIAVAVSFASVTYALLVANLVATSEQATIFTGVANLLMAALGGIMVPRFLMPPVMQSLSQFSPMAWGLEGFLDVFLRAGGIWMVMPQVLRLAGFGLTCLVLAGLLLRLRKGK